MNSLTDVLKNLREKISELRQQGKSLQKDATRTELIEPLLTALGWNIDHPREVKRGWSIHRVHVPIDYAILVKNRIPRLLIEVKAPPDSLDDPEWINRSVLYANKACASWCILTNGDDYHIYLLDSLSAAPGKPYRTVRITGKENLQEIAKVLSLFSKDGLTRRTVTPRIEIKPGYADFKAALLEIIKDPPPSLVKAIRWKTNMESWEIRDFLTRVKIDVKLTGSRKPESSPDSK